MEKAMPTGKQGAEACGPAVFLLQLDTFAVSSNMIPCLGLPPGAFYDWDKGSPGEITLIIMAAHIQSERTGLSPADLILAAIAAFQ
jgi:hypothetical protein